MATSRSPLCFISWEPIMLSIEQVLSEINSKSANHQIGKLQQYRKTIKGLRRVSQNIFGQINNEQWAFHTGGRAELQFNIGYDAEISGKLLFRHGVAFSYETSRSMTNIDPLIERTIHFNEYLRENIESLADFDMWHFAGQKHLRSANYAPTPISSEIAKIGTFVCLGRAYDPVNIDFDNILSDFDRLLPLYTYIESNIKSSAAYNNTILSPINFHPGCPPRMKWTSASRTAQQIDVSLRHSAIQQSLYDLLVTIYGKAHVGTEISCTSGGRVDLIVQTSKTTKLYEIKTGSTSRICIREAMGQLLDYAHWANKNFVSELFVVGEPPLCGESAAYLAHLSKTLPVPISYMQVAPSD